MPQGLSAKEFERRLADIVETFLGRPPAEFLTVLHQSAPIAFVTVEYAGRLALPHAYWFPWATARNRIETGVKLFIELKKNNLVLITVRDEADVKFFYHLCKYGLLRPVGKIWDYFADGVPAMVFQSVGS